MTKDPLSLGLIGLVEIIPAISMALFAGHIVDQKEKKKSLSYLIIYQKMKRLLDGYLSEGWT